MLFFSLLFYWFHLASRKCSSSLGLLEYRWVWLHFNGECASVCHGSKKMDLRGRKKNTWWKICHTDTPLCISSILIAGSGGFISTLKYVFSLHWHYEWRLWWLIKIGSSLGILKAPASAPSMHWSVEQPYLWEHLRKPRTNIFRLCVTTKRKYSKSHGAARSKMNVWLTTLKSSKAYLAGLPFETKTKYYELTVG